jgi:hypothetical protein
MVETTKNGNRFAPDASQVQDIQFKTEKLESVVWVLETLCCVKRVSCDGVFEERSDIPFIYWTRAFINVNNIQIVDFEINMTAVKQFCVFGIICYNVINLSDIKTDMGHSF